MSKKREHLYTILFSFLIFSSLMQPTNGIYHKISLVICLLLIGIFIFSKNRTLKIENKYAVMLFMLYAILSIIASLLIPDLAVIKYILQVLLMFFSITIFFNHIVKEKAIDIVSNGALIAYVPFLILCFVENNIIYSAFAGVFNNPNSMGFAMLSLAIVVLMKLYKYIDLNIHEENKFKTRLMLIFYGAVYLFIIYVIMLSNARTSLLATCVATLVLFICAFLANRNNIKELLKIGGLVLVGGIIIVTSISYVPAINDATTSVVTKNEKRTSSEDALSGRPAIWNYVLEETNLWGHGKSSLEVIGMPNAHNVFFNILRETGLLSVIAYLGFLLALLITTIRDVIQKKINEKMVFALLVLSVYLVGNTFESLSFHLTTLLLFLIIGLKQVESTSENVEEARK